MTWGMDDDEIEEEEQENEQQDVEEVGETDEMDDAWGDEIRDVGDDEHSFVEEFRLAVASGDVEDINVSTIEENYKELDDDEVLEQALEQDGRSTSSEVYERRLQQLTDQGNSEDASPNEDGDSPTHTQQENETQQTHSDKEETEQEENENDETSDLDEIDVESLSGENTVESSGTDEESETTTVSSLDGGSGGIESIDIGDVAPDAMTTEEAAEQPYLWRILGWAPPGRGKTHFGFTMPEPVCILDTEGKAHNLASKFEDKVTYIWQPEDYDEARDNLDEAITVLDNYLSEGHRGTIVVDSMSEMWEWSKQKYVSKAYQGKSLDEVNLSSNMGRSGESDWKVIKRYHNKRFRDVMLDTPFHIYWTAKQTDDYEAIMEGEDGNPKKPVGERDNTYFVEQVIRFVEGPEGKPRGQLQKPGSLSKYAYDGLEYPTFHKHRQVCEEIRELEEDGEDPIVNEVYGGDVTIVEGNPGRWSSDD